jgi:CRISPR-associated protein Cas1
MRRRYENGILKTVLGEAFERAAGTWPTLAAGSHTETGGAQTERKATVAFLYLTQQGAVLRKTGDRFLVEKDDQILADLPYHKLDHILIFGNIQLTTQAMGELLEKGVPVSLFSRQGGYRGSLSPARGKNVLLRLKQFEAYHDGGRALEIARVVVRMKIANAVAVIEQLKRHNPMEERASELEGRVYSLAAQMAALGDAGTVEALDGHEGTAARDYFAALMMFNKSGLPWPGRKQHPSEDPLNALLSLAYMLLMHEAAALLEGLGLDPYVGFLHQIDYGRPSLALDVIESFRHPVADRLVLRLFNKGVVGAEDFGKHDGRTGVFLNPAGLVRFLESYEKWMALRTGDKPSFRDLLKGACERMAVSLREGVAYEPYAFGEAHEDWNASSVTI